MGVNHIAANGDIFVARGRNSLVSSSIGDSSGDGLASSATAEVGKVGGGRCGRESRDLKDRSRGDSSGSSIS